MQGNGDPAKQTLEIDYPTRWVYKVIGGDRRQIEEAVRASVGEREHRLRTTRRSSSGRYVSLTVEVVVESEESRVGIFESLRRHEAVELVL